MEKERMREMVAFGFGYSETTDLRSVILDAKGAQNRCESVAIRNLDL